MVTTEFSVFTTKELLDYCVFSATDRTPLEVELTQRLEQAVEMMRGMVSAEVIDYVEELRA